MLEAQGAQVIEFPAIKIFPLQSYKELDEVIDELDNYRWIIFTSPNGGEYFLKRLKKKGKDLSRIPSSSHRTLLPEDTPVAANHLL